MSEYTTAGGTTYRGWKVEVGGDFLDPEYHDIQEHPGEDWNGTGGGDTDFGQPVYAVLDGEVLFAEDAGCGWGNVVLLEHRAPPGSSYLLPSGGSATVVWSLYGHLASIEDGLGSDVTATDPIGTVGRGYRCTEDPDTGEIVVTPGYAAHLHFEIRISAPDGEPDTWPRPAGYWPSGQGRSRDWIRARYEDPTDFLEMNGASSAPSVAVDPVELASCLVGRPALGPDGYFYAPAGDTCDIKTATIIGPAALHPETGSFQWPPVVPSSCDDRPWGGKARLGHNGISVGADGTVYAVGDFNQCGDGLFFSLNPADGFPTQVNGCPNSPHPRVPPPIDESFGLAYFGSSYLCSVDLGDLTRQQIGSGGYPIGGRGLVIDGHGNRFVATRSKKAHGSKGLVRSYMVDGNDDWTRSFLSNMKVPQLLAVSGGRLFASHPEENDTLYAWQTEDGQDVVGWNPHPDASRVVIDADGNVYASRVSAPAVIAFNSDGTVRWEEDLTDDGATWAELDFVDADGILYIRANEMLFALDGADKTFVWTAPYEAMSELAVPAALDADGRIVLFDDASFMYVLDTDLAYAASDWPIALHGTPRHTGAAPRQ